MTSRPDSMKSERLVSRVWTEVRGDGPGIADVDRFAWKQTREALRVEVFGDEIEFVACERPGRAEAERPFRTAERDDQPPVVRQ